MDIAAMVKLRAEAWWRGLAHQQRQVVKLWSILALLGLLYLLIWTVLHKQQNQLQQMHSTNKRLLAMMQRAKQQLDNQPTPQVQATTRVALVSLSQVEAELERYPSLRQEAHLRQLDHRRWHISFTKIDFNQLLTWLSSLTQHYAMELAQFKAKYTGQPGQVAIELELVGKQEVALGAPPKLVQWPLFGGEVLASDYPTTSLPIHLLGILTLSQGGQAVLEFAGQPAKTYAEGETLPGGALIYQVLPDAVVLQQHGQLEKLPLHMYGGD
jgi:type II secretory pathway component PulM